MKAERSLRRLACIPMTSHPSRPYTLKPSSARPTPSVPSTAVVRTLCAATVISPLGARALLIYSLLRSYARGAALTLLASPPPFAYLSFPNTISSLSPFLPLNGLSRSTQPRSRNESGAYSRTPLLQSANAIGYATSWSENADKFKQR